MLGVKQKKGGIKMKKMKLVSSFIVLLAFITLIAACSKADTGESYVTIDINPSIELLVSADEHITYANALNADGEILLSGIVLEDLSLEAAMHLIIETSIELGFISTTAEYVVVEVAAVSKNERTSNQIHSKVVGYINLAFENQAMIGRAEDKDFDDDIKEEAQDHNVSPEFLLLAKAAVYVNAELTLEVALEMEVSVLQEMIKEAKGNAEIVAQGLRDAYLEARAEAKAIYLTAKAEIEAQIEAGAEQSEALYAELESLFEAYIEVLVTLRVEFLFESQVLRLQYQVEFETRKQANRVAYLLFITELEARKDLTIDLIKDFQQNRP